MGLLWLAKPLKLTRGLSYLGDISLVPMGYLLMIGSQSCHNIKSAARILICLSINLRS